MFSSASCIAIYCGTSCRTRSSADACCCSSCSALKSPLTRASYPVRAVPPQADIEERMLEAQRLNEELRRMEVGGGGAHDDSLYGRVPLVPDCLLRVK